MLQLTRAAFVCTEPPEALDALRRSFEAAHVIRLPGFVDPELLELIRQTVRRAHFSEREDEGFAREACMDHNSTLGLLFLVMNDPKLFDVIRRITGCAPIGSFAGRIYLMRAGEAHHRWHSDVEGSRLIQCETHFHFVRARFLLANDRAGSQVHRRSQHNPQ